MTVGVAASDRGFATEEGRAWRALRAMVVGLQAATATDHAAPASRIPTGGPRPVRAAVDGRERLLTARGRVGDAGEGCSGTLRFRARHFIDRFAPRTCLHSNASRSPSATAPARDRCSAGARARAAASRPRGGGAGLRAGEPRVVREVDVRPRRRVLRALRRPARLAAGRPGAPGRRLLPGGGRRLGAWGAST